MSHSGKRDKGKHEARKKAAHTLKEKRQLKREKKHLDQHPEEIVGRLTETSRVPNNALGHG